MSYQPKLNLEMARLGYLGADPKVVGFTGGYQTRLTPPTAPQQQPQVNKGGRTNPYLKQK